MATLWNTLASAGRRRWATAGPSKATAIYGLSSQEQMRHASRAARSIEGSKGTARPPKAASSKTGPVISTEKNGGPTGKRPEKGGQSAGGRTRDARPAIERLEQRESKKSQLGKIKEGSDVAGRTADRAEKAWLMSSADGGESDDQYRGRRRTTKWRERLEHVREGKSREEEIKLGEQTQEDDRTEKERGEEIPTGSGFLGRLLQRETGRRGGTNEPADSFEGIFRDTGDEARSAVAASTLSAPAILSLDRINERPAYDVSRESPLGRLGHAIYRGQAGVGILSDEDDFNMIGADESGRSLLMLRHDHPRKYIAVVVDADQLIFLPDLLRAGAKGGRMAAEAVKRNVADDVGAPVDEIDVRIELFANSAGLRGFLNGTKTVSLEVFYDFLLGFINSSPLYRFVDTGRALQSADNKVRAVFVDYVLDNDCEQVYIGGLGDYGYRAELDSLRRLKLLHRVSLLGIPDYTRVSRFYKDYAQRKVSWAGDVFILNQQVREKAGI